MTKFDGYKTLRSKGFPPGTLSDNLTPEQEQNHIKLVEDLTGRIFHKHDWKYIDFKWRTCKICGMNDIYYQETFV